MDAIIYTIIRAVVWSVIGFIISVILLHILFNSDTNR